MSALRQTHLLIVIGLFASLQAVAQQPSSNVPPTVSNLVGKWTGTLTQPNSTYTFSLDVQQDGQGVKGTSRIENASNPAYAGFGVMQFSGTISQGKVHFAETAISQEQHVGSNTRWCLKKGDLTLNGDGSLSGSWNDPGCNAGSVSLKKVDAINCPNANTTSTIKVLLDNYIEDYKAELTRKAQNLASGAQSVLDGLQDFISQQSQQQNQSCGEGSGSTPESNTALENTQHGRDQLTTRGFTDEDIAFTKTAKSFKQADGADVFLKEVSPGKFNVIVEGKNGIITGLKNINQNAVNRLAKNYGWKMP